MNFRLLKRTSWVLAGALVLVACSSSSKSASTSPTTSSSSQQSTAPSATSAAPTATGAAIVIGGVCSCTSPLGNTSDSFEPYKAWVNTVNAAGGINGHPVKFTFIDDKSNPALSVAGVHTLIQNDHAIAIVDATGVDQGWASYVESANVPVVGSGTSSNTFFTSPDFYPEGQTMDSVIFSQVAVAKSAGSNSVGVMYCAEAPTCLAAVTPFKQAGQKLGVAVPVSLKISAASPSYTAQCVASQQAGANGMSVLQEFSVVDKVITDCTKQGYHPVWVADGLDLAPSWTSTPGGLYANVTNVPYFASLPSITTMNAAFDKYYPNMRTSANYNEIYLSLWASGLLFADAAKAGGLGANGTTPTSAQLVKGLTSLKGDTLQGMASPLTFPAGQPHPVDCWFSSLSKDGKQQLPNGTKVTCAS